MILQNSLFKRKCRTLQNLQGTPKRTPLTIISFFLLFLHKQINLYSLNYSSYGKVYSEENVELFESYRDASQKNFWKIFFAKILQNFFFANLQKFNAKNSGTIASDAVYRIRTLFAAKSGASPFFVFFA